MSEQTPNIQEQTPNPPTTEGGDSEPFIPPSYVLVVGVIGLVVALVVALTQNTFSVVGWGGLGIGVLSLIVWVFMAPDQARAIFTGRTARYGGTTVIVTVVFLAALVAIYTFVKGRNIRVDLTQSDDYSLNNQTRPVIADLGVEPKVPKIEIIAFYGASQADRRDQDTVLFDDYAKTSQNKISYEFVDPDRNPVLAQSMKVTGSGQIAVAPLDANGQPVADKSQLVQVFAQEDLSNAILRVAASGDFRAHFLTVQDGLKFDDSGNEGMSQLTDGLKNQLNWKVDNISFLDMANPNATVKLSDPTADGSVLVIPGGSKPMTDDQLKLITDYLDKGGKLVVMAAPINADGTPSLATADNLSTYLYNNFGIRFTNDVVLEDQNYVQAPFNPIVGDFDSTSFITQDVSAYAQRGYGVVFPVTHSIDQNPTLPANVSVVALARTSKTSFSKTDPKILTSTDPIKSADSDPKGPFVVAASAENSSTGARVVLIGSDAAAENLYASNPPNLYLTSDSMIWATKFEEFFNKIPQLQTQQKPTDSPIFIDSNVSHNINFLIIIVIPFGILLIGGLVWWNGREKAR